MKLVLRVVAVLAMVAGIIWILQGFNLLPAGSFLSHSFMMGQKMWAYYGIGMVVIGLLIFLWAGSRRKSR
jgi:hypothetical protein